MDTLYYRKIAQLIHREEEDSELLAIVNAVLLLGYSPKDKISKINKRILKIWMYKWLDKKMKRPMHDFSRPVWALTYLHDWDEDGGIYPEIHGVYESLTDALADQRAMGDSASKYHVHKTYYLTIREEK